MSDFHVKAEAVDVEAIMRQIRARVREKRGVDYTEAEVQELAKDKLEQFLDPKGVRSDLVEQFRRKRTPASAPANYAFEDSTIYETHRGPLRAIRRLLNPLLKLLFNPNPIAEALHIQSKVNAEYHERLRQQEEIGHLYYELVHNLALEMTRLNLEVHNLKMRVESLSSRMDFDERRARALEGVVQYRPQRQPARQAPPTVSATPTAAAAATAAVTLDAGPDAGAPAPNTGDGPGADPERRRRRRRRRRRPGQTLADQGSGQDAADTDQADTGAADRTADDAGSSDSGSDDQ